MLLWELDRSLAELTELYGFERASRVFLASLDAVNGLTSLIPRLDRSGVHRVGHRLQHRQGHQAGAGVVEVDTVDNAGDFGAKAFKINGHGQSGLRL
jgi:hypothetical protein